MRLFSAIILPSEMPQLRWLLLLFERAKRDRKHAEGEEEEEDCGEDPLLSLAAASWSAAVVAVEFTNSLLHRTSPPAARSARQEEALARSLIKRHEHNDPCRQ